MSLNKVIIITGALDILVFILFMFLISGCNYRYPKTIFPGPPGRQGDTGIQGEVGVSAISLIQTLIPIEGDCVALDQGLYVKNEGDKADIYNSTACSHGPPPDKAYCNNIKEGLCWIGLSQFSIKGKDTNMILYEIRFQ